MSKTDVYCLIMAGGKGTRFWPESTEKKPKQYLTFFNENSLIAETCDRFDKIIPKDHRYVVTVKSQKDLCESTTKNKINSKGIIFEPTGRNTGPCILLSLAHLLASGVSEEAVVGIVPSDHVILNKTGFKKTFDQAVRCSKANQEIVTIGITPHFPHTGFGYIEKGELKDAEVFKVSRFKEKPHFEIAKEYVASGNYLWNAGMFVAPIKVLVEEFKTHAPEMFEHFEALKQNAFDEKKLNETYALLPSDSFDYVVMEKSSRVSVVPAQFDWNDLGSWDALTEVITETNNNTVVKSKGEVFLNSSDNIIFAPGKFVGLINIDSHIVVVNDDVVMVAPVKDSQEIKKLVEKVKSVRPDLI
jgi:mannose-1-phosphate guanylyltransferase